MSHGYKVWYQRPDRKHDWYVTWSCGEKALDEIAEEERALLKEEFGNGYVLVSVEPLEVDNRF